jgi:hypothetical protein
MQLRTDHETFGLEGNVVEVPHVTTKSGSERVFGYVLPEYDETRTSMVVCDIQGPQIKRTSPWWL